MILVTGSKGFIGQALIETDGDKEFVGLERYSTFRRSKNGWGIDLSKKDQVEKLIVALNSLKKLKIKGVYHLAGVTPFGESKNKSDYSINLKIAESVVKICQECKINSLIHSSGWVIYDPSAQTPFDEQTALCPQTEYGISKLDVENYFKDNLRETKLINLRLSTIYGPGQMSYGLIPNLTKQALDSGIVQIQGVKIRRDYLYIKDLIKIFKLLSKCDWAENCNLNVGSGESHSVLGVATLVRNIMLHKYHKLVKLIIDPVVEEELPLDNTLNIAKLISLIGAVKFTNLKSGLEEVIKWKRKHK